MTMHMLDVLKEVRLISDEDMNGCEATARQQLAYTHPFKHATAARQHVLGAYNLEVLEKLRALREVLKKGKELME